MFIGLLDGEVCASIVDGRLHRNVEGSNIKDIIDKNASMRFWFDIK
jgi:hypothetical protein